MHRNRSRGAGLAKLAVTAAFIASPVYAGTVAGNPATATATRIEMPASISTAHAVAVSGETTVPLAAHTSMSSVNESTATKSDVAAHLDTASQPLLSMQHDASLGQTTKTRQPLHSAEAMKAPSTAISNAETSLAAPLTAATTTPIANAAHLEAAASQAPTTVRVASIDTSDASRFAHAPDISSANERQAPDRSGIKAETALPVSVGHTGVIATPPKSASKLIRTATVTAGARSKANSIRNRVWMRHPLN